MSFDVSAPGIPGFSAALRAAPALLQREMTTASRTAVVEGVGLAQGFAPVQDGILRASIGIIGAPSAAGGSYGTSLIYAAQREFGGTITGNPWLVFQVNGRWVKVRSVTQSGSHYMKRSADALRPRVRVIYGLAVQRVLASIGRAAD